MWILCFLLVIGLENKLVSCECDDQLRALRSFKKVNDRHEKTESEGNLFPTSTPVGNDGPYDLYTYLRVVKITSIRVDIRDGVKYSSACTISYSLDGIDFADYKTGDGDIEVFRYQTFNKDSESTLSHHFRVPIVAQYVRVIPHRGDIDVYNKTEFYGCDYDEIPYHFNGSSFVERSLRKTPIRSTNDVIRFRFKTFEANGVFLYATGLQKDHLGLMLRDNRLLLTINLGDNHVTRLLAGSLLDDGAWHDVELRREERSVALSVDRVEASGPILGDFTELNLDHVLYIGGVPKKQRGSGLRMHNYTGCVEALFSNLIDLGSIMQEENVQRQCPQTNHFSFAFLSRKSFIKFIGLGGIDSYEASLEFRTFEESGMLLLHEFAQHGYLKVSLKRGKLWTHLLTESSQLVRMENFEEYLSDGRWHRVSLSLRTNNLTMVVDENPVVTVRLISIIAGANTFVGGHVLDLDGFIGCMRKISINKLQKQAVNRLPNEEYCCEEELIANFCHMVDRCDPNPCEHDGVCSQTSSDFSCSCSDIGYGGKMCHTALLPMNCQAYARRNNLDEEKNIEIDIDGSGPLPAFPVTCYRSTRGHTVTVLHHENEATTLVDGFQEAGSYEQIIKYRANADQIEALTRQSTNCWQNLRYECYRSKLFNSPSLEGDFNPSSWWVSHRNQRMDFWGGAIEGSRKCECGMLEQCKNDSKWCNCDAGYYEWRSDGGDIVGKEYLPVKQLRFGDTGSLFDDKRGKYTLGPLHCEGNDIFSNVITLRRSDESIHLYNLTVMKKAYDFYFEFITGQPNGVILECIGQSGQSITVSIENGNAIRLTHKADDVNSDVFSQRSSSFMDNEWHTVYVEVNKKEFRLIVDGNEINRERHFSKLSGVVESPSSFSIGGPVNVSASSGFVGCLRAFLVNGELVDLVSYVRQSPYGLSVGCVGKCDSNPCLNNGSCVEYYNSYHCDCRWTSFKGPICADEIGAMFNGYSGVTLRFPADRLISTISEKIRIGFTTTYAQGILLKLYSNVSKEYFTLSITNDGYLRMIFDFGFERQECIYMEKLFNLGYFHDVRISRVNSGSTLKIQVDDNEPWIREFDVRTSADVQFNNIDHIFVGKDEEADRGFIGCISRVEFNDFYPLKLLFQQNPPNNVQSSGEVNENFCGIEPVTHPPEPIETRPAPNLPKDVKTSNILSSVAILAAVIAIVIVVAFFLGKYAANRQAFYHTREQIGAENATDADNAVICSRRGHAVLRRREWFI